MVVLRSHSALHTVTKAGMSHANNSASSVASTSSDPIEYEEEDSEPQIKTVRRGKDYRPESTFWKKRVRDMTLDQKLCNLATCPPAIHELKEETLDRGPVPVRPLWKENAFIISTAIQPIVIQSLSHYFFPNHKWPVAWAYLFYVTHFSFVFAVGVLKRMNHYCVEYGTFDEKNFSRDRTPDKFTTGLARGILLYMIIRTAMPFYWHYNNVQMPILEFTWTYPFRLMLWEVVLDYFFYVYHRSTHEIDLLWFVHKHHHTTKHPTTILSILAGDYQEVLEVFLVPAAASLLIPMSFSELYMSMCYTIYVEMLGHSGVRAYWSHPVLHYPLKPFGMELAVEDHDLHHRHGKSGRNYGKQSRVWDRIFGTVAERVETYGY